MFDDEPRVLENEQERSARHSRLVSSAVFFLVGLLSVLFGFVVLGNWLVFGDMRLSELLVPFLITLVCAGIGMVFEVRKRW